MFAFDPATAFAVFDQQDSGCVSYGIELGGQRLFVKAATTEAAASSLRRAVRFHSEVHHPSIVAPVDVVDDVGHPGWPVLVYPWHEGDVLNSAIDGRSDRRALRRFQALPIERVTSAIDTVLDAHLAVAAAGFVAVDLYDGCFLYDVDAATMRLIDLDGYRPGPFTVEGDRLPGSLRYMAPEELTPGATIDERSTVFDLGRAITHLLSDPDDGWRGTDEQLAVVVAATRPEPVDRLPTVADLVARWAAVTR